MKTNLKGIAFLLLPVCIVLGCESKKPVAETHVQAKIPGTTPLGPPPDVIYVGGEFKNPGKYPWTNGMTLQDGIAAAGEFTDFARGKLRVKHWGDEEKRIHCTHGKPLLSNPALYRGDQIIMPQQGDPGSTKQVVFGDCQAIRDCIST